MEQEKLYLVCIYCGEAFDDLQAAKDHEFDCASFQDATYNILPESEAI